jgi:hypothetical protein
VCKISGFICGSQRSIADKTCNRIGKHLIGLCSYYFPRDSHDLPTTVDFTYGSFTCCKLNAAVIPVAVDYKVLSDAFIGDGLLFHSFF